MKKVYDYLTNDLKICENDVIVVGNSGGPDSMALTYVLLKLRKKIGFKIICAHINHNVRIESKDEAKFLENYCQKNGIFFEHMIIEKYGDDNFHNEARTIRYNFFEKIVKKYNANYLMTAHHADDLMETVLMRLVRGSSFKGYGGFKTSVEKENYKLVRPLVFVTKAQIQEFNDKKEIPYVIDKSNFKDKYTRNRYRKNVLPFMKSEDLKVHEKFLKFSDIIYEYDNYINTQTKKIIDKIYNKDKLNIQEYKKLDKLIQQRVISFMLEKYYSDDLLLINDTHVNLIFDLIYSKKSNLSVSLPNNVMAVKSYDYLEIKPKIDEICDYEIEINKYCKLPNNHIIELITDSETNDNNICRLDSKEIVMPLYVRTRRIGDKMYLKKVNGSRKIKDIFIDSKVPVGLRDKWPIVVDSNENIIWIPGIKKSKFTKSKSEKCDIILRYL